ncbi:TniQ family protein [Malaciobacter sp. WC5094]
MHLHPLEDELLSSWLVRMAHSHFMYPTTFLNLYLKDTRRNSYTRKDVDFYNNKELFDLINSKSILS